MTRFSAPISEQIWDMKYRLKDNHGTPVDQTVEDTWRRIAGALAEPEGLDIEREDEFYKALEDFQYLPAGRITAGAGTGRSVTLFNCLAADTTILTKEHGLVQIGEIAGMNVHVLDGNGEWLAAPINSFGEQPVANVILAGGYNRRKRKTIRATAGHRWVMADGSEKTTEQLAAGDKLKFVRRKEVEDCPSYRLGVAHGLIYGDGSLESTNTEGLRSFRIRLCGDKADLIEFFDSHPGVAITEPPSFDGDPLVRLTGIRLDLKALPSSITHNVEYLTGFLRGWLATDGSVCARDMKAILSCGEEELAWLRKFGAIAGMEVSFATAQPTKTNLGPRNKPLFNVGFHRWTMTEDDFLLAKHLANFVASEPGWEVIEIGSYADPEPVYCPRVLSTDSVQLDLGIHTGQCYVMGTIPDSLDGIFDHLKEAALTMQQGGGIGYDFSTLRPMGAPVKGVESFSSGPISFMDVWNWMCKTIESAGNRRGAMMATMHCEHPDVKHFITAKQDPTRLRHFNVSVLVTDAFMDAVKNDADWTLQFNGEVYEVVKARELWDLILQSTYDYAEPGVIFIDRINKHNNLWFLEEIRATNPCFAGNQTLWTDQGLKTFAELEGQRVSVLTENQVGKLVYRPMDVFKTAENQEILRVTLDDGTTIDCTHTHEFFDLQRNRVEARDLLPGQRLASVYRHNANSKGYKRLTNGIDNPLEHHVPFEIIPDGFHVHHKNEIKDDNRPQNLELILGSDHNSYHMQGDRNPSITHPENNKLIQMDHSGSNNGRYREDLDDDDLQEMRKQGMSYIAIAQAVGCSKYTVMKRLGYERPNHKVVSVEPLMERQDVFCGTVGETHRFFLGCERGGVLVSNCGEQPLPPYGACLLGSINLARLVNDPFTEQAQTDWQTMEKTVRTAVRMLDCVIDTSKFPLEAQREEAFFKRRQGLGVTGVADMLFMLGIKYGSGEAVAFMDRLMKNIAIWAYGESIQMAKEWGPAPFAESQENREKLAESFMFKLLPPHITEAMLHFGIRNSHLLSIAPTGTISMYGGNVSSGIEPIFAPWYSRNITNPDGTKRTEKVMTYCVHKFFEQGGEEGDDWWRKYMVTAQDLDPAHHIYMQGAAQKWIDSSISKTVNIPVDYSFDEFKAVYELAYDKGCKGCTTYRPNDVTGSILFIEEEKDEEPEVLIDEEYDGDMRVLARPPVMDGSTYKIRWGQDSYYVTFNNIMDPDHNWFMPFEIFINSKTVEHHQWTAALTRMISAVFQRGGDVQFVAEELKQIHDPKGGQWQEGRYWPSLVALIGQKLSEHLDVIGYQSTPETVPQPMPEEEGTQPEQSPDQTVPDQCPSCKGFNLITVSGCPTCQDCGYSKCG